MNETNKMAIGGALGVLLIAALIYYFFYKSKPKLNAGPKIDGAVKGSVGPPNAQGVQNVYGGGQSYTTPATGTPDANIVAQWLQYSDTMKRIQQNLKDTCAVGSGITVDGILGNQTLNAIKGFTSDYGKQIAREIEATKYVTKAQADWLLKPCGTTTVASVGSPTTAGSTIGTLTTSNVATAPEKDILAFVTVPGASSWTVSQLREYAYAKLKGAQYFYCNNCAWGYRGYYSVANLAWSSPLPIGAKYVDNIGGSLNTK